MRLYRKVALCLLALPLMLNGLWVLCHEPPPPQETEQSAQPQSPEDELKAECEKLCARQSSLCLVSPGDRTSISIVVLGIAVFPRDMQIRSPAVSRERVTDLCNLHIDPSLVHPSPPPEI